MEIANRLAISTRAMQAMDFPHQGLLNVTDLSGDDLQLVLQDIVTLAAKVHHHDIPPLVSIVFPPIPLKLLKSLFCVVDVDGEVI